MVLLPPKGLGFDEESENPASLLTLSVLIRVSRPEIAAYLSSVEVDIVLLVVAWEVGAFELPMK